MWFFTWKCRPNMKLFLLKLSAHRVVCSCNSLTSWIWTPMASKHKFFAHIPRFVRASIQKAFALVAWCGIGYVDQGLHSTLDSCRISPFVSISSNVGSTFMASFRFANTRAYPFPCLHLLISVKSMLPRYFLKVDENQAYHSMPE